MNTRDSGGTKFHNIIVCSDPSKLQVHMAAYQTTGCNEYNGMKANKNTVKLLRQSLVSQLRVVVS